MNKIYILFILFFLTLSQVFAGTPARIAKISDGDTFIVQNDKGEEIKLRLLYMDTPEKFKSQKLKKDAEKCSVSVNRMIKLGNMATSYAKEYFKGTKNVVVDYYGKGYYGRSLAIIYKNGSEISYNFDAIANGYSCIYKKSKYPKQLLDILLKQAKESKKGLWGIDYEVMECLCN